MRSVTVVFPASTWAKIPTFLKCFIRWISAVTLDLEGSTSSSKATTDDLNLEDVARESVADSGRQVHPLIRREPFRVDTVEKMRSILLSSSKWSVYLEVG